MTPAAQDAIRVAIQIEGGYVNDPQDPGGETKYGISKRMFPAEDIPNLTEERAAQLYYECFWEPSRADNLDDKIRRPYFLLCIHSGQRRAARILQEAINDYRSQRGRHPIPVDGEIGVETIAASKGIEPKRLLDFAMLYYARIVIRRPTQLKYWHGWCNRLRKSVF